MEKEYAKDYPIPFHNDVFFKYMLIGDDAGSALLRSRIIEEIYGLKVHETKVLNPELLPEAFFGKRAVLDVVLEDEAGHFYDLEMQVSGYTQKEQLRFQQYGYRLVGRQLKQGDEYTELKPFYQIIFMNDKPKDGGRMIRHYKVKDEDNQEEPNGTLNRAIVFLPVSYTHLIRIILQQDTVEFLPNAFSGDIGQQMGMGAYSLHRFFLNGEVQCTVKAQGTKNTQSILCLLYTSRCV